MKSISLKEFEKDFVFVPKEQVENELNDFNSDNIAESMLKLTIGRGIRVQSVCAPASIGSEIKDEKTYLKWLSNTVHNEFYSSRVLFLKYNPEGSREDWQNNKATNRRYIETTTLYKKGLYFNKLFQTNN